MATLIPVRRKSKNKNQRWSLAWCGRNPRRCPRHLFEPMEERHILPGPKIHLHLILVLSGSIATLSPHASIPQQLSTFLIQRRTKAANNSKQLQLQIHIIGNFYQSLQHLQLSLRTCILVHCQIIPLIDGWDVLRSNL